MAQFPSGSQLLWEETSPSARQAEEQHCSALHDTAAGCPAQAAVAPTPVSLELRSFHAGE